VPKIRRNNPQFWDNVDKTNTCWIWNGLRGAYKYGRFMVNGKEWRARD
jgi:hypothetical protein